MDEPGVVTLSARQPMAGVLLTATLTDPDSVTTTNLTGSIDTGVEWQWQKGSSNIPNADHADLQPAGLGQRLLSTGDGYIQGPREPPGPPRWQMSGRAMLCCGP